MFLKVVYVGDTLGEVNKLEVPLGILKKDVPIKPKIYKNNHVV